ncbi:MAG: hypothetical protein WCT24_00955 [Patescibacteria group bacterium]
MTYKLAIQSAFAVMLVQVVLLLINGYWNWPTIDIPMHFAGGAAMGMLGLALWNENVSTISFKNTFLNARPWIAKILFIVCFAGLIGIVWEFFEFAQDYFFGSYTQPSLQDSLGDLFCDLLGGLSIIFFTFKK